VTRPNPQEIGEVPVRRRPTAHPAARLEIERLRNTKHLFVVLSSEPPHVFVVLSSEPPPHYTYLCMRHVEGEPMRFEYKDTLAEPSPAAHEAAATLMHGYCVSQFPKHAGISKAYEEFVKNRPKNSDDEKAEEAAGPKPSMEAKA